jgi:hypothetical protein
MPFPSSPSATESADDLKSSTKSGTDNSELTGSAYVAEQSADSSLQVEIMNALRGQRQKLDRLMENLTINEDKCATL